MSEARLRKEKQFNRKVEINAELRILKQELEEMVKGEKINFDAGFIMEKLKMHSLNYR